MKSKPLVSVVMSTYNPTETFFNEAVSSVLNQTYKNFELIIINDGSSSDVRALVDAFQDARIVLVDNKENKGLTKCLNQGLALCKGKYIARMDDDDICHPDRLKKQVCFLETHPRAHILGSYVKVFRDKSCDIEWKPAATREQQQVELLFLNAGLCHPSVMMRKSFLDRYCIRYNESFESSQDYELWSQCVKHTKLHALKKYLIYYRIHGKQISMQKRGDQKIHHDSIIKIQLNQMSLAYSEEEFRLHTTLAPNAYFLPVTSAGEEVEVAKVLLWAQKLLDANKHNTHYDQTCLKNSISRRFAKFLAENMTEKTLLSFPIEISPQETSALALLHENKLQEREDLLAVIRVAKKILIAMREYKFINHALFSKHFYERLLYKIFSKNMGKSCLYDYILKLTNLRNIPVLIKILGKKFFSLAKRVFFVTKGYLSLLRRYGIYSVYRRFLSDIGYVSDKGYLARKNSKRISKIPTEQYSELLKAAWPKKKGKLLDLNRPKTFGEKLQWLKLYDNSPLKTRLADKFAVRAWVAEKIGEEYLVPLLGVWDRFRDIDFKKLPEKFVLKTNHASGRNIIVKSKKEFSRRKARILFNDWLKTNYAFTGEDQLELVYKDITPRIIAEEYLETPNDNLLDYKILCFHGKPTCVWVDSNRFTNHTRDVFDFNWNKMPFDLQFPSCKEPPFQPQNLALMYELAGKLSEGFYHVRVDFYEHEGKVYFGEMTFHSHSGHLFFTPEEWDEKLGALIKLPI